MPSVAVLTLGCKVNRYDSQALMEAFQREGFDVVPFNSKADVYVVNTCAVTSRSGSKSRQAVRRAAKRNPGAVVVVTGCYSQVEASLVAEIPGVSVVSGTGNRREVVTLAKRVLGGEKPPLVVVEGSWEWEEMPVTAHQGRARAFVKVQDGCEQFCSYCIVPYARGPVRSRPLEDVLKEVVRLVDSGYREVVLSGVHLGLYSGGLAGLVRSVAAAPGLGRVRLSSVEPQEVDGDLLEAMASSDRVCRHLHIPLQSGSDQILYLMNRGYTAREYLCVVGKARDALPGLGLTADVMVGFPGEGEEEFLETIDVVKQAAFSRLHVFRYSERPGTVASSLPGRVSPGVREERAGRLSRLGRTLSEGFHRQLVGKEIEVLVEEESGGMLKGYSSSYVRVLFPGPRGLRGGFARVVVTEALGDHVAGRLASL